MKQEGVFYWYAVHTPRRHADKANLRLQAKSINTFLPKIEVWSKRKDRKVIGPLVGCEGIILDLKRPIAAICISRAGRCRFGTSYKLNCKITQIDSV